MSTIAVIGASNNRNKYGNKAVRAYTQNGDTVYPINPNEQSVEGLPAYRSVLDVPGDIELATFYVPPAIGIRVLDEVARKGITRVLLNPGAQSAELLAHAAELGIATEQVCSILRIGRMPGEFA